MESLRLVGKLLVVEEAAMLKASQLRTVGGDVGIYENAKISAIELESVEGTLLVSGSSQLSSLQLVGKNLFINKATTLEKLTTNGGSLGLANDATLGAEELKKVMGFVDVMGKLN